jgi:acylpyruvate hydrolase
VKLEVRVRFISFKVPSVNIGNNSSTGLAIRASDGTYRGLTGADSGFPGDLGYILGKGQSALFDAGRVLARGRVIDLTAIEYLPPVNNPGKVICIGLNYRDHSAESGFKPPEYPAVFARFNSSLIGHMAPIVRPKLSQQLDYEGELAAVIGLGGRHISLESALEHIAGYSLFNDASIRDFQFKSPQWTMGKNFDATGAFGPEFISADELPPGCKGLGFETRLNGVVVQKARIDDLIFDVASLVSILSDAITLSPGDVIVTGTPGGVGLARKPPLWMKPGDCCVIASDQLGMLSNSIVDET